MMKKYHSVAELLKDYRKLYHLSRNDIASKLDVDSKTVQRWESGSSLIKTEKEKDLVEQLNIPHQVVRNLNSHHPIAVYFDMKNRIYALSTITTKINDPSQLNFELGNEDTSLLHRIQDDSDLEFVNLIQLMNRNNKPLHPSLLKEASLLLPDLNLVLKDHSGFYAGHVTVLPLKHEIYLKIRNQEMEESSISVNDLVNIETADPKVFYYYSIYADYIDNVNFILNALLTYFKTKNYPNYILAGITYRDNKVKLLENMGLHIVWQKPITSDGKTKATFLEGDLTYFIEKKLSAPSFY